MIDFSEDDIEQTTSNPLKTKWAFSITHIMVIGFTTLAFIPIALLLILSYPKIQQGFDDTIENELIETSLISKHTIEKWFNELTDSVIHESHTDTSKEFLTILTQGFHNSEMELKEFVYSDIWNLYTQSYQDYYFHFSSMNKDFYDIFLIDNDGNILFTLAHESDLGTNLKTGIYKDTLFAKTYNQALLSSSTQFSDLEYYAPSNDTISGFIISPIINDKYQKIGAFALQINFDTAIDLHSDSQHKSLVNYIINDELLLRTPINNINNKNILSTKISNKLTDNWSYNLSSSSSTFDLHETYTGVDSNNVIGIYHTLNLINKRWGLIYEIDKNEVYAPLIELKSFYMYLLFFSVIITLIFSYILASKINKPIKKLNEITKIVRSGEVSQIEDHKGFKETNELASNFNKMIEQQSIYENALDENRRIALQSLNELENIQFALDQHSIISITNLKGDIIYCNEKFTKISEYSKEELLNNNHRILNSGIHSHEFWRDMFLTITKNKIWHGEIKNKSKTGKDYWVQSTIVPITDTEKKVERYISIRTDITDRKLSEIELTKSKELAESAVVAKSEFLASMSHEIRTPMNGILGMLNILKKTKLDDYQNHKVDLAKNSAKGLLTIINDILDFSKIEAGKLDIEEIEFNLIELLGEVSESVALNAQEKNLEVILDYQNVQQEKFIGDPSRVKQILFNLAGNAVKFTTKGSITIEVSSSDIENKNCVLSCRIIDTGIGIEQDKLSMLFEKFTQADNSTTREYGGTGLGLAIVKQLVQLMNGRIKATSTIGKGSCFSFDLSVKANLDEDSFENYQSQYQNTSILIIDSQISSRNNIISQFERLGANCSYLDIYDFNLVKQQNNIFDLILVDEYLVELHDIYKDLEQHSIENDIHLVVMTKVKSKAQTLSNHNYQFSFPKPAIFRDIIYCLDTLDQAINKTNIEPLTTAQEINKNTINEKIIIRKILLVEDNFVNQQVALSLLEELHCDVEIAENGKEAIDKLNAKQDFYEIILMDCQMPIMDGYTASHKIRLGKAGDKYSNIPIIALTANAMKGDKEKCLAAGMDDYLSKPIDQQDLENKLNKYLN